jgi:hypothetical protein
MPNCVRCTVKKTDMLFTDQLRWRVAALVTLCGLLALWLWSLVCWRERVFFADPAFVVFRILNAGHLVIMEHRYGAVLTQGVVLMGSWLGLSLKTILFLYTGSFLAFYTAVGVMLYRLKQYIWVVLLFLYQILIAGDTFYWSNNEVHQGLAWLLLFLGVHHHVVEHSRPVWWFFAGLPILFLALLSHVLVFVPFALLWVLAYPHGDTRRRLQSWWVWLLIAVCLMGLRYYLSVHSFYDSVKLQPVQTLSFRKICSVWTNGHMATMWRLLFSQYWVLIPIFLWGLAGWVHARLWWPLACWLGALFGYAALVGLVYPDAFERPLYFYIESEWQAFGMLAALPFVHTGLGRLSNLRVVAVLLLVFVSRWPPLYAGYQYFHSRYERLERLTTSHAGQKLLIVSPTDKTNEAFIIDWGLPVESLLLSQTLGYKPQTTIKVTSALPADQPGRDAFYGCFKTEPVDTLNSFYFQLDTGVYQVNEADLPW